MSRTKVSYLISDGLGPYLRQKLCHDMSHSGYGYTIQHDETGNSQGRKQCDILLRYWSEEKNEVSVRLLQTLFFGHAKGHDVGMKIVDTVQEVGYQLPLSGLISLSSYGPNVDKTICNTVNKVLVDEGLPGLNAIHPLYHSRSAQCLPCRHKYLWRSIWGTSPSRREDYVHVLSDLGLDDELFIRHVQCKWLTLLPALDRIVKSWEAVKEHFLEELPKQATEERTIKS